ncbi:hypothetical protein BQ8482_290053 [Mesorhizobium delmotii]|uniref:Uncharacterized protein n=1 Tax=Mesorhizobium delmotii TaxID=1631247 RepID=A0A2P9AMU9_9HYPH|nr:hypothetical protein BQ8482_290053 [Mesorhizobium delmotii]
MAGARLSISGPIAAAVTDLKLGNLAGLRALQGGEIGKAQAGSDFARSGHFRRYDRGLSGGPPFSLCSC